MTHPTSRPNTTLPAKMEEIAATRPRLSVQRWSNQKTRPRLVTLGWTSIVPMGSKR